MSRKPKTTDKIEVSSQRSAKLAPTPKAPGKLATIVALLRKPKGATLAMLCEATGWQKHSVRGAMSGSIKKAMGLTLVSEKAGGVRTYRIVDTPVS